MEQLNNERELTREERLEIEEKAIQDELRTMALERIEAKKESK